MYINPAYFFELNLRKYTKNKLIKFAVYHNERSNKKRDNYKKKNISAI